MSLPTIHVRKFYDGDGGLALLDWPPSSPSPDSNYAVLGSLLILQKMTLFAGASRRSGRGVPCATPMSLLLLLGYFRRKVRATVSLWSRTEAF